MGQKCLHLAKIVSFGAKFGRFLAKNPFFWGDGVKLLEPLYQATNKTPLLC